LSRGEQLGQRSLDLGSIAGLLLASPLLAVAALVIKLSHYGPALYKQERIGQAGKPFPIFKPRTMTVGAENKGLGLLIGQNDPRITKMGQILGACTINELPQLLNVLRGNGEMSLVGPCLTFCGSPRKCAAFRAGDPVGFRLYADDLRVGVLRDLAQQEYAAGLRKAIWGRRVGSPAVADRPPRAQPLWVLESKAPDTRTYLNFDGGQGGPWNRVY
jgi:hypothetical protein